MVFPRQSEASSTQADLLMAATPLLTPSLIVTSDVNHPSSSSARVPKNCAMAETRTRSRGEGDASTLPSPGMRTETTLEVQKRRIPKEKFEGAPLDFLSILSGRLLLRFLLTVLTVVTVQPVVVTEKFTHVDWGSRMGFSVLGIGPPVPILAKLLAVMANSTTNASGDRPRLCPRRPSSTSTARDGLTSRDGYKGLMKISIAF